MSKRDRKLSEEHKRKISEEHKKWGALYWTKRPEVRRKISQTLKGRPGHPQTEEVKIKIGLASKKKWSDLKYKKNMSERMRKILLGKNGELARNWQGGKSFEPYSVDWNETLRQSIRERDRYICRLCGKSQGDRAHSVHHIDYCKQNCNPDNLITLCVSCNVKVNKNRNYWTDYFKHKQTGY